MAVEIRDVKYYDVPELVAIMKVSKYTIQRWAREGRLRAHKIGRKYMVSSEDLRRYIESGPTPSPPKVKAQV